MRKNKYWKTTGVLETPNESRRWKWSQNLTLTVFDDDNDHCDDNYDDDDNDDDFT